MRVIPSRPSRNRRRKFVRSAAGYFGGRHKLYRTAREVVERAWQFQYAHRRLRKRQFRKLWIARINAATRANGISYSKFMGALKRANIRIDRKMLAIIAFEDPMTFAKIAQTAMSA